MSKPVPPQALIDELVSFFERQGQPHEQARILAVETATNLVTLSPGWNKGAIHAENIGEIVSAGFRQGLRRLTLTIEAEGNHDEWFGHLRVTVVDTETWQEWAEQRNRDPTLN